MIARIRLKRGRPIQRRRQGKNRQLALSAGALLAPAALMAYVLGFWRLAADMGMAGPFGISGVFSHWQIWIGLGALLQAISYSLNRYGRGGDLQVPHFLTFRLASPPPAKHFSVPTPIQQRRAVSR